jgi:hypothetical protein
MIFSSTVVNTALMMTNIAVCKNHLPSSICLIQYMYCYEDNCHPLIVHFVRHIIVPSVKKKTYNYACAWGRGCTIIFIGTYLNHETLDSAENLEHAANVDDHILVSTWMMYRYIHTLSDTYNIVIIPGVDKG